ncbi:MAG: hypothetical protein WBP13_03680 [Methylophilaceae bacterium]
MQTIVTQTAFQIPAVNTAITSWTGNADDGYKLVPLPFTFNYAGAARTQVYITTNGFLTFSSGSTRTWTNYSLFATTIPADAILGFWDDLNPGASTGGSVTYGTVGSAPNREFVVSFNNIQRYNVAASRCSFQMVLGEDQTIRFRYNSANVQCNGNTATIGLQESASSFIQYSYNSVISLTQDVLYSPVPSLSFVKTVTLICDPINGTSNPKNIMGAISRYTLTITNLLSGSAILNTVTDGLVSFLTLDPNLVVGASAATCVSAAPGVPQSATGRGFNISVAGSTRSGYPKFLTSSADGDGATFASPNVSLDFLTALPAATGYAAGELKGGESVTVYFNTTVN